MAETLKGILSSKLAAISFFWISLAAVGCVAESIWATPLPSLVMALLFVAWVTVSHPMHIVKFFFIYFSVATNLMGVFVIEVSHPALPELGLASSFYSGSFSVLVCYYALFFSVLLLADNRFTPLLMRKGGWSKKYVTIVLVLCVGVAAVDFMTAIMNPSFVYGVDRFEYRTLNSSTSLGVRLTALLTYFVPIAVMAIGQGNRVGGTAFLLLFASAGLLQGNKFGLFSLVLYLVILGTVPYLALRSKKQIVQAILAIGVGFVALVGVVLVHNFITYGTSFGENVDYLSQRLAQQGQLWWRIFSLEDGLAAHLDEIDQEISVLFEGSLPNPVEAPFAIYKIMLLSVADPTLFYNKVAAQSSYAYSGPAMLYYYFRFGGMAVFAVVFAPFYAALINAMTSAIAGCRVLEAVLLVRILVTVNAVFTQGNFFELFSWKMGIYIGSYLILVFLREKKQAGCLSNLKLARTGR